VSFVIDKSREKRISERMAHKAPIQFFSKDSGPLTGCIAKDISESGIQINLNDFLPLNTELTLNIQLDAKRTVECAGKVVWIRKLPVSDRYLAGLEFSRDDSLLNPKAEIHHFIKS